MRKIFGASPLDVRAVIPSTLHSAVANTPLTYLFAQFSDSGHVDWITCLRDNSRLKHSLDSVVVQVFAPIALRWPPCYPLLFHLACAELPMLHTHTCAHAKYTAVAPA